VSVGSVSMCHMSDQWGACSPVSLTTAYKQLHESVKLNTSL